MNGFFRTVVFGAGAVGLLLTLVAPVSAEGLTFGKASRKKLYKLLDSRLAVQYENSKRLLPQSAAPPYIGPYKGIYLPMAEAAAAKYGVPKDLFTRLIQTESNWNQNAVSPKGAIGLAQLMPDTAARLGVNPKDAKANLEGGARYLKMQFLRFRSWKLALAAYNAGPEAVEKYDDVPPYAETQAYVVAIMGK